jgi:hypothetical protein
MAHPYGPWVCGYGPDVFVAQKNGPEGFFSKRKKKKKKKKTHNPVVDKNQAHFFHCNIEI